jgi:glycopeptide antibiotics resistance protein
MQINLLLAFILFIFLFFIFPTLMIIIFFNNKKVLKIAGLISFIVYCLLLSVLVFGKINLTKTFVTISFENTIPWFSLNFIWANFGKTNVIYNLIMLFPVAAFVISQTDKNIFLKTVLISFVLSFIIEFLQFILPVYRTTEVFDIVTNTISGIIGFAYFYFVYFIAKNLRSKK